MSSDREEVVGVSEVRGGGGRCGEGDSAPSPQFDGDGGTQGEGARGHIVAQQKMI